MEVKKSKKAEIESRRGTWLLMGFIAVLAFMFVAFEWAQYDKRIDTNMAVKDLVYTADLIPITVREKPLPPPPPAPVATDNILVVDNTSSKPEGTVAGTEMTNTGITPVYIPPVIDEPVPVESEILDVAEVMPEYPGGRRAMNTFLAKNMKYPAVSIETGSHGKVIVQFVVDKDGSITNARVVRGIDPHLDKEALRVINLMPKWSPGKMGSRTVRVKYTMPVVFQLQ